MGGFDVDYFFEAGDTPAAVGSLLFVIYQTLINITLLNLLVAIIIETYSKVGSISYTTLDALAMEISQRITISLKNTWQRLCICWIGNFFSYLVLFLSLYHSCWSFWFEMEWFRLSSRVSSPVLINLRDQRVQTHQLVGVQVVLVFQQIFTKSLTDLNIPVWSFVLVYLQHKQKQCVIQIKSKEDLTTDYNRAQVIDEMEMSLPSCLLGESKQFVHVLVVKNERGDFFPDSYSLSSAIYRQVCFELSQFCPLLARVCRFV